MQLCHKVYWLRLGTQEPAHYIVENDPTPGALICYSLLGLGFPPPGFNLARVLRVEFVNSRPLFICEESEEFASATLASDESSSCPTCDTPDSDLDVCALCDVCVCPVCSSWLLPARPICAKCAQALVDYRITVPIMRCSHCSDRVLSSDIALCRHCSLPMCSRCLETPGGPIQRIIRARGQACPKCRETLDEDTIRGPITEVALAQGDPVCFQCHDSHSVQIEKAESIPCWKATCKICGETSSICFVVSWAQTVRGHKYY